jgi:hypothetical protein
MGIILMPGEYMNCGVFLTPVAPPYPILSLVKNRYPHPVILSVVAHSSKQTCYS